MFNRIKRYFKLREFKNATKYFTEDTWNDITAVAIYESVCLNGEKSYRTLIDYCKKYELDFKIAELISNYGVTSKDALKYQVELTEDQRDLLHICRIRSIKNSVIDLLKAKV